MDFIFYATATKYEQTQTMQKRQRQWIFFSRETFLTSWKIIPVTVTRDQVFLQNIFSNLVPYIHGNIFFRIRIIQYLFQNSYRVEYGFYIFLERDFPHIFGNLVPHIHGNIFFRIRIGCRKMSMTSLILICTYHAICWTDAWIITS